MTTDAAAAVPLRRGLWSPPVVDFSARAILSDIDQCPYVRLRDISPRIGWTPTGQKYAIREGLLEAEQVRGPGSPYLITKDEACMLLLAAALALAAGMAIAVMLRSVKGAGITAAAAAAAIRNMPA